MYIHTEQKPCEHCTARCVLRLCLVVLGHPSPTLSNNNPVCTKRQTTSGSQRGRDRNNDDGHCVSSVHAGYTESRIEYSTFGWSLIALANAYASSKHIDEGFPHPLRLSSLTSACQNALNAPDALSVERVGWSECRFAGCWGLVGSKSMHMYVWANRSAFNATQTGHFRLVKSVIQSDGASRG